MRPERCPTWLMAFAWYTDIKTNNKIASKQTTRTAAVTNYIHGNAPLICSREAIIDIPTKITKQSMSRVRSTKTVPSTEPMLVPHVQCKLSVLTAAPDRGMKTFAA